MSSSRKRRRASQATSVKKVKWYRASNANNRGNNSARLDNTDVAGFVENDEIVNEAGVSFRLNSKGAWDRLSASVEVGDKLDRAGGTMTGTLVTRNVEPDENGQRSLGKNSKRFANIYSSDLDLSNQAKGGNSVDGTWGSYLIEEGEEHLYLTNRRSGKKYRFVLEEL